jgi:menaquinol-cytochrome c reductase iron-sulfur subunit
MSHDQRSQSAYDDPGTPEEVTRRTFMANATLTLSGIIGLGLAIPIVGALTPKVGAGTMSRTALDDAGWKQLQESTDTPVQINFVLSGKDAYLPEQQSPEAVWGIKVPDLGKFKKLRPDIYDNLKGNVSYPAVNLGFAIFSPICPHLGCRFDYHPELNRFRCGCHGSTYDKAGAHLAGPATRGLDPLPLREQSGKAQITWIRYAPTIPDRIVVSYID